MSTERKTSDLIASLKRAKTSGDDSRLPLLLSELTAKADLDAIREQKILFGLAEPLFGLCSKLICDAAERIVAEQEAQRLRNYCLFVSQVTGIREGIDNKFRDALKELKLFSLGDLLVALNDWLNECFEHISSQVWERQVSKSNPVDVPISSQVAQSEEAFQTVVGNINEVAFASARLINEAAALLAQAQSSKIGSKPRRDLRDAIPELISLAQLWNNTQFVIDKVSYGEWRVETISEGFCAFAMVDSRLDVSRILGLRREAAQKMLRMKNWKSDDTAIGKRLADMLPSFLDSLLDEVSRTYQLQVDMLEYWDLRNRLGRRLIEICAEDDLLLIAASEKSRLVHCDYISCAALRWNVDVTEWLDGRVSRRKLRSVDRSQTTTASIVKHLPLSEPDRASVQESLEDFCSSLPRKDFYSILSHPFSKFPDESLAVIPALEAGQWNATIRSKWIQNGEIGHRYGHAWEEYLIWSLEGTDWKVIARNINLKNQGKRNCEIDFLIAKDEVCLVVQMKAFAGLGLNMYDHWRNRQTIQKGVHQAKLAVELLNSKYRLSDIVGKKAASPIRVLRPLVLSSLHYFNGWQNDDVSVLSVTALSNLVRGASLEFRRGSGEIVNDPAARPKGILTGAEVIEYLDYPLDWRIAQEIDVFTQKTAAIGECSWSMPLAGSDGVPFEIHRAD